MIALKQYGERRTGTNHLRAFLMANYPGLPVFMHVLGDKHSPPVDFHAHWEQARSLPDPAFRFISSTTWASPAETTSMEDPGQLAHLRRVATLLTDEFRPDRVGYLISTKNPYAWAVSLARYSRWLEPCGDDLKMGIRHRNSLEIACHLYNRRHEAWLRLHRQAGGRSFIVRHESLLEEPHATLASLQRKFALTRCGLDPVFIRHRTGPIHWDDHPLTFETTRFDPNPYRDRAYRHFLSEDLWSVVRNTIDWNLAGEFGYRKLHFH